MIQEPQRQERLRNLRGRRDLYLRSRDLEVFQTAPNPQAEDLWLEHARTQAAASGDHRMVSLLTGYLDGVTPRPNVTSTEALFEPTRTYIESRIAGSQRLSCLSEVVLVDEYPTGAFNAQVSHETDGYIIYLNAGTRILLAHFAAAAIRRGNAPMSSDDELFLTDVVTRYVSGANLFMLPAPVPHDLASFLTTGALDRALQTFCIAHEYGHILGGHLTNTPQASNTPELLAKTRQHEFEADEIASIILLGDTWPHLEGQGVYDRIKANQHDDGDIRKATELSAAVSAAPVFFAIANIITAAQNSLVDQRPPVPSTHPEPADRYTALTEPLNDHVHRMARAWWPFATELNQLAQSFPVET